jgi:hypothetical protein
MNLVVDLLIPLIFFNESILILRSIPPSYLDPEFDEA